MINFLVIFPNMENQSHNFLFGNKGILLNHNYGNNLVFEESYTDSNISLINDLSKLNIRQYNLQITLCYIHQWNCS